MTIFPFLRDRTVFKGISLDGETLIEVPKTKEKSDSFDHLRALSNSESGSCSPKLIILSTITKNQSPVEEGAREGGRGGQRTYTEDQSIFHSFFLLNGLKNEHVEDEFCRHRNLSDILLYRIHIVPDNHLHEVRQVSILVHQNEDEDHQRLY